MTLIEATENVFFEGVYPIGATDPDALPVKALGPAIGYYTRVLGFTLMSRHDTAATLKRDDVMIGLEQNDADPEQASCYFAVRGVDLLQQEYANAGIAPTEIMPNAHDGRTQRIFFAKEPYGVCFCFGQTETE